MRIIVQRGDTKLDILNLWLSRGCPERMTVNYDGQRYEVESGKLITGPFPDFRKYGNSLLPNPAEKTAACSGEKRSETSEIAFSPPNEINNLASVTSAPKAVTRGKHPVTVCDYCGKPFEGSRRFCKPSHKTLFYRHKKAERLLSSLGRGVA
jgi:hypothetical protein